LAAIDLSGRVALITGAGRGLGRSHALMLADRGAAVVVNDLGTALDGTGNDTGVAGQLVSEIQARGGTAIADTNDVSTFEGGAAMAERAVRELGRLDIVVNNAGILRDKAFANMTPGMIDAVLAVHLRGAFSVLKAAWPVMREQGYGRVVNTSSDSGIFGNFGQANYGAAKTGLIGLTRVLAIEGQRAGIKVNAIGPVGLTRMTEDLMTPERAAVARNEQVSAVVTYLASEECPVSGEIISVRRGRVARIFIGITKGYVNPDLTAEDVRDNWPAIWDLDGYGVPETGARG
jgi:NAD(P)-dependent dehydrogenase (short-subunit alcohol dehydrogenase family)